MNERDIDLNEWWVVLSNGEWWCGKKDGKKLVSLNKVNMPFSVQPTQNGGVAPRTDVLVYPWFTDSLVIPEGAIWSSIPALIYCDAPWAKLISASENLKLAVRAKRSGLHLA